MKKIIKWTVGGLVLVIIIGAGIFWFSLNRIVRSAVESQASSSLAVKTTLGGADVSPLGGKVALDDLKIASPAGFTAENILTLAEAKVGVKYGELRDDPIRIDTISLKQPTVVLEQRDLKTNVQALMDGLPKTDTAPANKEPMKVIIGDLTIENPTVVLRPGFPGLSQEIKLTLPTIDMKNIGRGEGNQNGAAIKDVVMLVLTQITSKAADSDQLPAELRGLLNLDVKSLAAKMKDQLNVQVEKISEDLTKKIGGDLGSMLNGSGNATTQPKEMIQKGLDSLLNGSSSSGKKKKK